MKKDHVHRNHTVSLSPNEKAVVALPDTEHLMIQAENRVDKLPQTAALIELMKNCLSETQY